MKETKNLTHGPILKQLFTLAITTGGQIEAITWNTSQGFSTALSAFVAQNYAARQISRVLKAYHTTLWMTFVFGFFCTFLFICYGNEIFSIFVPGYSMEWGALCLLL